MIGGQEIDQHLFLIACFVLLHRIHEFIKGFPAPSFNIILQPPVDNDLFLVKINSVALFHIRGNPYKFIILNHGSSPPAVLTLCCDLSRLTQLTRYLAAYFENIGIELYLYFLLHDLKGLFPAVVLLVCQGTVNLDNGYDLGRQGDAFSL